MPGSAAQRFETEWLGRSSDSVAVARGDRIVKTQGMTRAEVEAALAQAGLKVPESEKPEIAGAAHFIEEMAARVRSRRDMAAEPAHIFPPPGG